MASGDFLELSQRACYQARYNPGNTTDLTRAKEAINECYMSVLNSGDRWTWAEKEGQFTISSTTDKYSVSSIATAISVDGISEIYNMTNDTDGGYPLEGLDWLALERASYNTQDGDPRGCPYGFATYGDQVRFYPWPDQSYTIGIIVLQDDNAMSADADVPLIPLSWRHRILVPYAAMRLMEQHSGADALGHSRYYREQYERDMVMFREKYASAQFAQMGLETPTWNSDLPGSYHADYLTWYVD